MVKTIVGMFDTPANAQSAATDLIRSGFAAHDVSVVASDAAGEYQARMPGAAAVEPVTPESASVIGGLLGGTAGLTLSLVGLAVPGLGLIAAAGPLLAALGGAGAGAVTGGLIGALTESGIAQEHATNYAEAVRRGGAFVTVLTDPTRTERAADIMSEHGAVDLEQRVLRWREDGWTGGDNSQNSLTTEAERERRLYGTHSDPITGLPTSADAERDNQRDSTIRH